MKDKNEVTVKTVLHKGLVKLYVYDPMSKIAKRYSLNISSSEEKFDTDSVRAEHLVNEAKDVCTLMRLNGAYFDFAKFEHQFFNKNKSTSIKGFAADYIETVQSEKTRIAFRDMLKSIETYGANVSSFGSITPMWIHKYVAANLEVGNKEETAKIHLRQLRSLYNKAKAEGLAPNENPFKGRSLQSRTAKKRYLTRDELTKFIEHKYISHQKSCRWRESRDLFLFSFWAHGINLKDIWKLKYSNIIKGTKGELDYWWIKRTKNMNKETQQSIAIWIYPEMREIMERYKTNNDLVFYKILGDPKQTNALKEKHHSGILGWIVDNLANIAKHAGITNPNEVVFYSARHTFAVHYLKHSTNPSIFKLMAYLGHASETSTKSYIARLMGTEPEPPVVLYNEIKNKQAKEL